MVTTLTRTGASYVLNPRLDFISLLVNSARYHGKDYSFMSHEYIRQAYHRTTGHDIGERALNNHLGALERDGYFARVRRHVRGPDGSLILHSTLYRLKRRAWGYWRRLAGIASRAGMPPSQVLDSSAVQESAQYQRPTQDYSPAQHPKEPPAEWQTLIERLRRLKNPRFTP